MKALFECTRARIVPSFGLLLTGLLLAAPAAAYWGAYTTDSASYTTDSASYYATDSASYAVEAAISPSEAAPGDVVWIDYYGAMDSNGSYEVLFSAANTAASAVVTGTGYGSQIEVVVPDLPPGPVGVEVTTVSNGSLVLSTSEQALLIIEAMPTPAPSTAASGPTPTPTMAMKYEWPPMDSVDY